ncbi:MAG: M20 family metallopeptidase [Anaerolineae bacterium]|nr:M20 family metallopeptidase [Anaerolineae bacterium]
MGDLAIDYQRLSDHAIGYHAEMIAALDALVSRESPSTDKAYLDTLAGYLKQRWEALGAQVELVPQPTRGNHLRIALPGTTPAAASMPPALLLGHFDTVWPLGTIDRKPFEVVHGRATGPGVYDMKGGLVIAEFAWRAIQDLALPLPRPVVLVLNADEEIGSATSRALIETEAAASAYVLVLEPSVSGGALKTARKGVGAFTVTVEGRASHAGVAPQEGASAIEELARQILRLHAFTDYDLGTTVNVGVIAGGTRSNVVAAHATARVDTRAWTREEARRLESLILGIEAFNPETTVTVTGSFGRVPFERTPGTIALFEVARRVGEALGMALEEASSGGASDGNLTAAMGVPTLDGLGAVGDGAHAEHEYVDTASLPKRAALLAGLLCEAGDLTVR